MPLNFEVYVPDNISIDKAIARTTHMCVAAHQDDVEIMAYDGILKCFGKQDTWFAGVVLTDGAGSPRKGVYEAFSDDKMREIRGLEQKKAAFVGNYSFQALLKFSSSVVKSKNKSIIVEEELAQLLELSKPEVVYTHNPADKHDTHVAVLLRTLAAIRRLPKSHRPKKLYGCEVWRGLDWLVDKDKLALDVSGRAHLEAALLGVFDSQIAGGKRYDLAAAGRRLANATFAESHAADEANSVTYAMDLTPLIKDDSLDAAAYAADCAERLKQDIISRVRKFS